MKNNYYKLLERLLVYFTLTPFICCTLYFFESIVFTDYIFAKSFISFFSYLLICFQGILFLIIFSIILREKKKFLVYFIFAFFYFVLEFIIFKLFNQKLYLFFMPVVTLLQFVLTINLNNYFTIYDSFIDEWESRDGEELQSFLYKNNALGSDLGSKAKQIKTVLYVLTAVFCIFIIFIKMNLQKITFLYVMLFFVFFSSLSTFLLTIKYIYYKSLYGFLGNRTLVKNLRHYIKILSVVSLIALLPAIFISRNEAFFDIRVSAKDGFSASVNHTKFSAPVIKSLNTFNPDYDNLEQLKMLQKEPSVIIKILLVVLQAGIFAGILYLVFIFLIKPLFSKELRDYFKERRLQTFFRDIHSMIKDFFKNLFKKSKTEQYMTVNSSRFMEYINNYSSKKSREKVIELGRLSKHFLLLVKWAEKKDIKYTKNLAPVEFTRKIKSYLLSSQNNDEQVINMIMRTGFLFEKALFDKDKLSKEQEKEFISSIKTIIE